MLTLKALIATAADKLPADDILKYLFFDFSKKISLDISCDLSAKQTNLKENNKKKNKKKKPKRMLSAIHFAWHFKGLQNKPYML